MIAQKKVNKKQKSSSRDERSRENLNEKLLTFVCDLYNIFLEDFFSVELQFTSSQPMI